MRYQKALLFLLLIGLVCPAKITQSVITTIAIVATNDIHGMALPVQMQRADTHEEYSYGGLPYMGGLINIIQKEYPGHTLFLDAGDQFQGGIEASKKVSSGQIMNDFYSTLGLSASALGNHEFDFGPSFMWPYLQARNSINLVANIRDERGVANFFPKQQISHLFKFGSGIKIGVIGLTTIFTPQSTNAFKEGLFPPYTFLNYTAIVIAESKKLRENGANAVLVLGHLGNDCDTDNTYGIWKKETPQPDECSYDQASKLIDSIPKGTIDGIIQGHRHKFAHQYYKDVPFLGTINGGYYFNIFYLRFEGTKLLETEIEGPVPVCDKIFEKIKTCDYQSLEDLPAAGTLVSWNFHGVQVKPNLKLKAIYDQQWIPRMQPFLTFLVNNEIYLAVDPLTQCELSNLITNLYHAAAPSDIAFINPGGLRTTWIPGRLLEEHFYNMFPFTNRAISIDMTGAQLLAVLKVIQEGPLGFYPCYGIQQVVTVDDDNNRKFISAKWINGSQIDPNATIRAVSNDFLLNGGDDFSKVIGKIYTVRNPKDEGQLKDVLRPPLIALKTIKKGTLIDPSHRRLIVN